MNFSIVVPEGCNANCSFCFWKEQTISKTYISDLLHTLDNMPVGCALSITGGEPTISSYFDDIIQCIKFYKHKFEKVILTTNGSNLDSKISVINGVVDHINVSRHHHSEEVRDKIFGARMINDDKLKEVISKCNEIGIDVTLNAVVCGVLETKEDVLDFVNYAKNIGASAITFRKDYGEDSGLQITGIEKHFENYKSNYEYSCPVCRTKSQLINGLKVTWKSSAFEPSVELKDVYELVFQPSGKLTIDWDGKNEILISGGVVIGGCETVIKMIKKEEPVKKAKTTSVATSVNTRNYSSCGGNDNYSSRYNGCGGSNSYSSRYSGCGGSSSYTSRYSGCGG